MSKNIIIHSNKAVQKAGKTLINKSINSPEHTEATEILSSFRSLHLESLEKISNIIYTVSMSIDKNTIVGKRLKRIPSIVNKLKRFENMKLNRMQDIAGCRAILSTERKVRKLEKELLNKNCEIIKDYIKNPKEDGYRGIHLINKSQKYPIEIQLRTKIQHSWATAVEIVDLFEDTTLKTNIGTSPENLQTSIDWLDFFRHMSNEFSLLDHSRNAKRIYPLEESLRLIERFNIVKRFLAYTESLKILTEHIRKYDSSEYNLIRINLKEATLNIESFSKKNIENATKKYIVYEREAIKNKNLIIAFVSTESFKNLKDAYPNYFADSELFIKNIQTLEKMKINKRSWIDSWLNKAFIK